MDAVKKKAQLDRVTRPLEREFVRIAENVWFAWAGLTVSVALLVVIPLSLWFAWVHAFSLVNSILVTLFCVSFAWGNISLVLFFRSLRKLGLDGEGRMRLLSGPRPTDPDELHPWLLGWHFMFAVLAVLLSMIAIPVASWLGGK
jgi:hypothetical protein